MRAIAKLLLLLIVVGPLAVAALAWFMLAESPTVTDTARLSHEDVARAKAILDANDPRRLRAGETRRITIPAHELNLAASYLARQLVAGKARLALQKGALHLEASRTFDLLPARNVLNLTASIREHDGQPKISGLRLGEVALPGPLADPIVRELSRRYLERAGIDPATPIVRDLRLYPDRVELTYRWHPGLIDEARDSLLTGVDREAMRFYHDRLVELQRQGTGNRGALTGLLSVLFASAGQRSETGDPVMENTALLTVLGTWAGRRGLEQLVPGDLERPGRFRLKLHRRYDFAQHFLVSAALAARGDSGISDAIGLAKEIVDSDRGSGFSFSDIAADRSGGRFGALATRSRADALRLQRLFAGRVRDKDLMPRADDLPEHMDAETFEARFGHVGSPAYEAMMAEIERRIDAIALYRN